MNIGQEGDTRRYKRLRNSDYYEAKAVADAETIPRHKCVVCKRLLGTDRKNWNGYCFECKNEPL